MLARTPEVGARGAVLAGAEARGEDLDVEAVDQPGGRGGAERREPRRSTTPASQHQMELLEAARPLWHTRAALATEGDRRSDLDALAVDAARTRIAAATTGTHDLVVVGGGVTGAGVALDAAARGLSVVLLEAGDLAVGTSSRSGKTMHGGLRYLEQLNFSLVFGALRERDLTIKTLAPHLVGHEPFLYPLRHQWEKPYVGSGVGLYDAMATMSRRTGGAPHARYLGRQAVAAGGARARPGRRHRRPAVPGRADGRRPAHAGRRPHRGRLRGARDHVRAGDRRAHRRRTGRVTGVTAEDVRGGGEVRRLGPGRRERGRRVGGGDPAARRRAHLHHRPGQGGAPAGPQGGVRLDDGHPVRRPRTR